MRISTAYCSRPDSTAPVKPQFPGFRTAISGFRYYNPSAGRWLSRDPIGERGGVNVYGIKNDVVNHVDFLGLTIWEDEKAKAESGPFVSANATATGVMIPVDCDLTEIVQPSILDFRDFCAKKRICKYQCWRVAKYIRRQTGPGIPSSPGGGSEVPTESYDPAPPQNTYLDKSTGVISPTPTPNSMRLGGHWPDYGIIRHISILSDEKTGCSKMVVYYTGLDEPIGYDYSVREPRNVGPRG